MSEPTVINDDDVYWEMDWAKFQTPNKLAKEMMFEDEPALARLLAARVVLLNDHWWEEDWPDEAKKRTSLNVNCNDVFAWGCADSETINYCDIQSVYDHWLKDPRNGVAVWCCKKRNELPQRPVLNDIKDGGIWDIEAMGLRANVYDAARERSAAKETKE